MLIIKDRIITGFGSFCLEVSNPFTMFQVRRQLHSITLHWSHIQWARKAFIIIYLISIIKLGSTEEVHASLTLNPSKVCIHWRLELKDQFQPAKGKLSLPFSLVQTLSDIYGAPSTTMLCEVGVLCELTTVILQLVIRNNLVSSNAPS